MALHKISRDDIDPDREIQTLRNQIEQLRQQLRTTTGEYRERIREMIQQRTSRIREIHR